MRILVAGKCDRDTDNWGPKQDWDGEQYFTEGEWYGSSRYCRWSWNAIVY